MKYYVEKEKENFTIRRSDEKNDYQLLLVKFTDIMGNPRLVTINSIKDDLRKKTKNFFFDSYPVLETHDDAEEKIISLYLHNYSQFANCDRE